MNEKGVQFGTGIKFPSDVDLSKVTMSMDGQTLKLMNDGTQVANVEIPTTVVADEQLTSIIQSKIDDGTLTSIALGDDSVKENNIQDRSVTPNKTDIFYLDKVNIFDGNVIRAISVNDIPEYTTASIGYGTLVNKNLIKINNTNPLYLFCKLRDNRGTSQSYVKVLFSKLVFLDQDSNVLGTLSNLYKTYNGTTGLKEGDTASWVFIKIPTDSLFDGGYLRICFNSNSTDIDTISKSLIVSQDYIPNENMSINEEIFGISKTYFDVLQSLIINKNSISSENIQDNSITQNKLETNIIKDINVSLNAITTPTPQEIYTSIESMIPNNSNMCNMKMIGNIFNKEDFHNDWCLNNCFYDKDLDRIVHFYNARDSHEQGRGTIKMRTINKNDPMDISKSSIVCNPLDIDSSYTDYSYVTNACEILSDGTYMIIADLRKSSNNCGQYGIYVFKSVDKGKTWTRKIITFTDGTELTTTSFGVYSLKQSDTGRLHCCHYSSTGLLMYHSDDLGETWDKIQIENTSGYKNNKVKWGAGIAVLGNNKIIVYQRIVDSTKPVGLCITKSDDDGNTWSGLVESKTLQDCANTPPAVIVHDGMVELCYGTRYIRSDEGHPRIYYTNCTINDAWNDNYKQPKIIGYGITAGQDFGYFGGCADDNGNLHIFYYDSDFEGTNTKYIRGDRNIKPLPFENKISGLGGIYLNGGSHNYRISANKPLAEPTYVNTTLKYGNLVGNNLDDYLNKFDYFTNDSLTPSVSRVGNVAYNSFYIQNAYYNTTNVNQDEYPLGVKIYVKPYTDYIVEFTPVNEFRNCRLAVYGKNKKVCTTPYFERKDGQCVQTFNTGANTEIILATVQDNIKLLRGNWIKDFTINEYKNVNILNKIQHISNVTYSDYPLYYINDVIKDSIENGVYYKNVASHNYLSTDGNDNQYTINVDTDNQYASIKAQPFIWTSQSRDDYLIPGHGGGDIPLIAVLNDDEWISTTDNADKTSLKQNRKKFVHRGLTVRSEENYYIPLEDLGLTVNATTSEILTAWRIYISLHPTTVLFYYPQPLQVIDELPLCIPKDGMLINNNENIDILVN